MADTRARHPRLPKWLNTHVGLSLGLLPRHLIAPLHAEAAGGWRSGGARCEKVALCGLAGLWLTGNLFRPDPCPRRFPVVLCPHGHWPNGRLYDSALDASIIARCLTLARMGAVVFSYDMVGYGDSAQLPHAPLDDHHWGLSLAAIQTLNSIRALDFVLSLPGADPRRVGVTGASGGGTQAFLLAAVDDRVTASAPVCMISSSFHGGCTCENPPLLRLFANNVDIACLHAPKPLFVGSCTGDWTRDVPRRELPAIRRVYSLLGAESRVSGHHVDAGHNYNHEMREAVYRFFGRWFFNRTIRRPIEDVSCARPPLRDQMVWWGRPAPPAVTPAEVVEAWRTRASSALAPALASSRLCRAELGPLLPHTVGLTPETLAAYRKRRAMHVKIDHEDGRLVVRPASIPPQDPDASDPFVRTYRRAPHAEAVMEIAAAVHGIRDAVLVGEGAAGPWCLMAMALSPGVVAADVDMRRLDDTDAGWARALDIPCIRQVGGLATIFAMIGGRRLTMRGASPAVRRLASRMQVQSRRMTP